MSDLAALSEAGRNLRALIWVSPIPERIRLLASRPRVRSTASVVELDPVPATTGTRPEARSTQKLTTASCSSLVSVALSPVVPHGTSPWIPESICLSITLARASQSTPYGRATT